MASPEGCKTCHAGGLAAAPGDDQDPGHPFMAWDTWAGSMMANAARDPLFLASVTLAEQDSPGSGTYCLRCHTPSAFVESRATPGNGANLSEIDREGVHCAVCHRSVDASQPPFADAKAPYVGNAQLFFDLGTPTEATYRGPYDDSSSTPAHQIAQDPFVGDDSRLCGQCHQVENPDENLHDASGMDLGRPFPLDTTYEEWLHSAFSSGAGAKSCAGCHMPAERGLHPIASGAPDRDDPPRHDFAGGNEWGPAVLKAAFPGLRDAEYDRARAAAQATLRAAAKMEIKSLPATGTAGGEVALTVRVTNLTGHKLPTGYADGRRMWLEIAVVGAVGADVQSGAYDQSTAELRADAQLRIYEAVHGRDGAPSDHIVRHRQILKDTRIPPRGFEGTPATMPVGPLTFSDGAGGFLDYDDAVFRLKLPADTTATVTVRVRLLFQAVTAHHVAALAAENTTDSRGSELLVLWQQTGKAAPFVMGEVTQPIEVKPAVVDVPPVVGDSGCGCAIERGSRRPGGLLAVAALFTALSRRRGSTRCSKPTS
jgi:MYXO-CTERM domain-containing protein